MLKAFDIPLSWGELLKRTLKDTSEDDALGLAAQLAYYLFLALFPAILFLLALGSFFPLHDLAGALVQVLRPVASEDVIHIVAHGSFDPTDWTLRYPTAFRRTHFRYGFHGLWRLSQQRSQCRDRPRACRISSGRRGEVLG